MTTPPVRYKSPAAEARFKAKYESLLSTWHIQPESIWVTTEFGESHVLVAGAKDAPPIVLIPGAQATAGMWGPLASKLSLERKLYCVDLIDQVGLSRPTNVLSSPEDSDLWLGQTLDGLGLAQPDLVGNSIGAFIAAKYASANPDRVSSLVLTAPAATVSTVSPLYILKVIASMSLPIERLKTKFLLSTGAGAVSVGDPLFQVLQCAMSESNIVSKLVPRALTEQELLALTMPVLLLQGRRDSVNSGAAEEICQRMAASIPNLDCETLDDAGHLWAQEHFIKAGELIAQFLKCAR